VGIKEPKNIVKKDESIMEEDEDEELIELALPKSQPAKAKIGKKR
jgi:hypothetical protein